ncbi:MAG: DUF2516 family protein [Bifidobacteriaceae bacterium]|jgi:hypothetical protein|nr:DUF2516 family protein [Bifidobacteriaceae bacterium]
MPTGNAQWVVSGILASAVFVIEVWAFASAAAAPSRAYPAAGRLTKGAWLGITGGAAAVGLASLPTPYQILQFLSILSIASIVAALVYLVSVRPKVRGQRPPGGTPRNQTGTW